MIICRNFEEIGWENFRKILRNRCKIFCTVIAEIWRYFREFFENIEALLNNNFHDFLQVVEEPYTMREARIHIRHVRDLLKSLDPADAYNGVDCSSLAFLNTVTQGDVLGKCSRSRFLHSHSNRKRTSKFLNLDIFGHFREKEITRGYHRLRTSRLHYAGQSRKTVASVASSQQGPQRASVH